MTTLTENERLSVFVDSNVIIDGLILRDYDYQPSRDLIRSIIIGKYKGYICAKQITDIYYIFRKYLSSKEKAFEYIKRISRFFEILPLLKGDILACLSKQQKDFEDTVLVEIAKANMIPILVTNNVKDYEGWPLLIVNPEQFLMMYQ